MNPRHSYSPPHNRSFKCYPGETYWSGRCTRQVAAERGGTTDLWLNAPPLDLAYKQYGRGACHSHEFPLEWPEKDTCRAPCKAGYQWEKTIEGHRCVAMGAPRYDDGIPKSIGTTGLWTPQDVEPLQQRRARSWREYSIPPLGRTSGVRMRHTTSALAWR